MSFLPVARCVWCFCFVCLFVITAGYIRVGVLSVWMILWRSGIPGLSSARELITSNKSHTIPIKTCSHSSACNVSSLIPLIAVVCGFGCILGDAGELPVRLGAREVPTPTHPASNHPRIHPIVHPSIHPEALWSAWPQSRTSRPWKGKSNLYKSWLTKRKIRARDYRRSSRRREQRARR